MRFNFASEVASEIDRTEGAAAIEIDSTLETSSPPLPLSLSLSL